MAVEQFGFAGGFMTAVMSTGCDGLTDMTTGEVVVGGVALEVLERCLAKAHDAGDRWNEAVCYPLMGRARVSPIFS